MKKSSLLIIFVIGFFVSIAQEPSHCNVNPMLRQYYDLDVKDAALRWAFECDSNYRTTSALIPQMLEDSIWRALAAVFNVQNMPERDSAIDMYCIHQYPRNHLVNEIILVVDEENPFIISWLNQDPGYPILDSILSKYGFISFDKEAMNPFILLRTEQKINIYYVLHLLKLVDGVIYADPNLTWGDGNGFDYRSSGTDRFLYFDKAWGDCMAGCYAHHIWPFKIDENCRVEYMGTLRHYDEDESIGEPWNCNITGIDKSIKSEISVFPNPVNDYIQIKNTSSSISEFEIRSMNGQLIKKGQVYGENRIDVSYMVKGVYMIHFSNDIIKFEPHKIIKL